MAQAKRIQVNEVNTGVGGNTSVQLIVPTDPREEVNFHNIWGSVSVEPQNADANCQGTWVLYILRENQVNIGYTDAVVNGELFSAVIIACGVYSASNQSPYNSGPIHPSTSRNLMPGDALILQSITTGVTAGLCSNRVMLCAHTTRK